MQAQLHQSHWTSITGRNIRVWLALSREPQRAEVLGVETAHGSSGTAFWYARRNAAALPVSRICSKTATRRRRIAGFPGSLRLSAISCSAASS